MNAAFLRPAQNLNSRPITPRVGIRTDVAWCDESVSCDMRHLGPRQAIVVTQVIVPECTVIHELEAGGRISTRWRFFSASAVAGPDSAKKIAWAVP